MEFTYKLGQSFTQFKTRFYDTFPNLEVFNFGKYNATKIVLDGLKVNYKDKFPRSTPLFGSLLYFIVYYFFKSIQTHHKLNLEKFSSQENKNLILLFDQSSRIVRENDCLSSLYFEKIKSFLKTECSVNVIHAELRSTTSGYNYDISLDKFDFLRYRVFRYRYFLLAIKLRGLYNKVCALKVFSNSDLENIRIAFQNFFENYIKYDLLFQRLPSISCVLIENHYHNESLIFALKRRNIKVIEIQHGLIAESDIFYVMPQNFKEIVSKCLFPDLILVYGNYWKDVLLKGTEYSVNNIVVLGDFRLLDKSIDLVLEDKLNAYVNDRKIILITTQTFMEEYYIDYILWLHNFIKHNKLDFAVVVKIHPSEKIEAYKRIKDNGILLLDSGLYYLFERSYMHLSIYSTTLYEAAAFVKYNFSIDYPGFEDYRRDILNSGVARSIGNREFFIDFDLENRIDVKYFFDNPKFDKLREVIAL